MSVVYVGRDAVDAAKQRSLVSFFKPVAVASSTRDADSSSHVDQDDEVEVLQAGGADGYEVGSDAGERMDEESGGLEGILGEWGEDDDMHSGAEDRRGSTNTPSVETPHYCAGTAPEVREPVLQHYHLTVHGIGSQATAVAWEVRVRKNRIALHALATTSRGIFSPGCTVTVEQPGQTCRPCTEIKYGKAYRGESQFESSN